MDLVKKLKGDNNINHSCRPPGLVCQVWTCWNNYNDDDDEDNSKQSNSNSNCPRR